MESRAFCGAEYACGGLFNIDGTLKELWNGAAVPTVKKDSKIRMGIMNY